MVTPPNKFIPQEPAKQPLPAKPQEKTPVSTGASSRVAELKQKMLEEQKAKSNPPPKAPIKINRNVSVNNNNNNNSSEDGGDVKTETVPGGKIKEMQGKIFGGQNNNAPAPKPLDIGYKPDVKGLQNQLFGKKEAVVNKLEIASHERAGNISELRSNIGKLFGGQGPSVGEGKKLDQFLKKPGMSDRIAAKKAELEKALGHQGEGVDPEVDRLVAQELADYFLAEFLQEEFDNENAAFSLDRNERIGQDAEIALRLQNEEDVKGGVGKAQVDPEQLAKEVMGTKIAIFNALFEDKLQKFGYTYHEETMAYTKKTLGVTRNFTMEQILAKNPKDLPMKELEKAWEGIEEAPVKANADVGIKQINRNNQNVKANADVGINQRMAKGNALFKMALEQSPEIGKPNRPYDPLDALLAKASDVFEKALEQYPDLEDQNSPLHEPFKSMCQAFQKIEASPLKVPPQGKETKEARRERERAFNRLLHDGEIAKIDFMRVVIGEMGRLMRSGASQQELQSFIAFRSGFSSLDVTKFQKQVE